MEGVALTEQRKELVIRRHDRHTLRAEVPAGHAEAVIICQDEAMLGDMNIHEYGRIICGE